MTDPIRAALERLIARLDETTDPNGPVPAWSDSFYAARAALSADGPAVSEGREPAAVVGEPSNEELREIWETGHLPTDEELANDDGEQDLQFLFTSAYYRWLEENPEAMAEHESKCIRAVFNAGRRFGHQPALLAPIDLDELLGPQGAYEPGTGQEDGAQLLTDPHGGNPQWWRPLYGCDTLDNLLDRIRARILPHLRPPISGIDLSSPDGDYGGLQELCDAEGVDVRIGAPLLRRAREAWGNTVLSASPAEGEGEAKHRNSRCFGKCPPPAEGEVAELVAKLRRLAPHNPLGTADPTITRAADLLSQRHSAPVPVAERSPEPEDCDGEGRCWWWNPPTYLAGTGWWEFEPYEWIEDATHWLPAHALPLPAGEVQP